MTTFIVFTIALGILVFVHEWGHFIVAKKSGVRVDIFSIGFGPKIFGFTWGGTEYRIAPFPFGGYVKIYGQDPHEEAEGDLLKASEIARHPDSFASKSIWKRLAVVFAGPAMNLVLCLVLLPMVFMIGRMQPKILDEKPVVIDLVADSPAVKAGFTIGDEILKFNNKPVKNWKELLTQISLFPNDAVAVEVIRDGKPVTLSPTLTTTPNSKQMSGYLGVEPFEFYDNEPLVGSIKPASPAEKAGFKIGDQIVSVNALPVKYWTRMTEVIQKSDGSDLSIVVRRDGVEQELKVKPEYNDDNKVWVIGITKQMNPESYVNKQFTFIESLSLGWQEFNKLLGMTVEILGRLFSGNLSFKTLGGPLQIAQATSSAAKSGFGEFLYLLAFLSMQLGIMNLLPIPVLDGGHVVFMTIETLIRRPLSPRFRMVSMQLGLVMLLGLMLFVTINDVNSIWGFANILESIRQIF